MCQQGHVMQYDVQEQKYSQLHIIILGMSLIVTKSIIQYKFDIDIRIEIIQKISIFSRA